MFTCNILNDFKISPCYFFLKKVALFKYTLYPHNVVFFFFFFFFVVVFFFFFCFFFSVKGRWFYDSSSLFSICNKTFMVCSRDYNFTENKKDWINILFRLYTYFAT